MNKKMKSIKKGIALVMAIAVAFCAVPAINANAAVKLNKTKVSIGVGETFQLKLNGAKSVKWSTSDKKVASVSAKGKVKGIKAGKATITALNSTTKKTYKCKITVLKTFGYDKKKFLTGHDFFSYNGTLVAGSTYYMDGIKLTGEVWDNGEGYQGVALDNKLDDGKHTLTIKKSGYKTFTLTFTLETVVYDTIVIDEPMVHEGTLYLFMNPAVEDKVTAYVLDGTSVTPKLDGMNGDGYYCADIDVSKLSKGEHTIKISAEGFDDETVTFTIE
ncbi:Ig-like domain (group 2) [Lachnospiraceae bacterium C10]|nr:Ig-like domain (group 2) [Lachnospiraceae bacterium C10]